MNKGKIRTSIKRGLSLMLIAVIMTAALFTFISGAYRLPAVNAADGSVASFNDIAAGAPYKTAVERIAQIGIMAGDGSGSYRPDDMVTREQFAKIIVVAAKLEGQVKAQEGIRIFTDVDPNGWSGGYINVAWANKLISSVSTWYFNPQDNIAYEYVCNALCKVLGYGDTDVTGQWPANYIDKAASLGITEGVALKAGDSVTRWMLASMISKLLDTKMKSATPATALTYAESKGLYTPCIVLVNSSTSDKVAANQIITDKGTYYLNSQTIESEVGKKYGYTIINDTIMKAYNLYNETEIIVVESILENRITYKSISGGNIPAGTSSMMTLSDKTVFYYNGAKVTSYETLKSIIKTCTRIIYSYNLSATGYEYAVIIDPVYSSAHVVMNYYGGDVIDGIDVSAASGVPVIRDGELITKEALMENDVLYQVSDIGGSLRYVMAVSNKIEGIIAAFLPNKISPQEITIGSKSYDISKDMDLSSITNINSPFKVGERVLALLGYDGKIVALVPSVLTETVTIVDDIISKYAYVLNTSSKLSTNTEDYGRTLYYAKLLLDTGAVKTFRTPTDSSSLKGLPVEYAVTDVAGTSATINEPGKEPPAAISAADASASAAATATAPATATPSAGGAAGQAGLEPLTYEPYYINRDIQRFGDGFVSDNVVIFNLINRGTGDTEVRLVKWEDMPGGQLPGAKVLNVAKEGDFDEVTLISLYDLYDQRQKTAVIKSVTITGMNWVYTLFIDGKEYKYSTMTRLTGSEVGTAMSVEFAGSAVVMLNGMKDPDVRASSIQAVDMRKIKINGKVYAYKDSIAFYSIDLSGNVTRIGMLDLSIEKTYREVAVYLDKPGSPDGLAEAIVVAESAAAAAATATAAQ